MRVTVLGASGLIGRAVWSAARAAGHEVKAIDRPKDQRRGERDPPVHGSGDLTDLEFTRRCLYETDAVVHVAGKRMGVGQQRSRGADLLFRNLAIDLAVLTAARERRIPRLVYASTVSVYPEHVTGPSGAIVSGHSLRDGYREADAAAYPAESVRYSAWGKLTAERLIESVAEQDGLHWSVVRLVNTYGPHDNFGPDALVVPSFIQRAFAGEDPFEVQGAVNERDLLYVDDAAGGILAALQGPPGVYNLGSGKGYRIGAVARMVVKAVGHSCKLEYAAGGVVGASRKVVDPQKAFRELSWSPRVAPEEGIQRTVDWYRQMR